MNASIVAACLLLAQDPTGSASAAAQPPATTPYVQVVLKAANDATSALRSVRYEAVIEGTGALAVNNAVTEGTVILEKIEGSLPNVHVEGVWRHVKDLAVDVRHFAGAIHNNVVRRIDHTEKLVVNGGGGLRSLGRGAALVLSEFDHPAPFQDEIDSGGATLEGRGFVHDVLCDVVLVEYGRGRRARWYFGADDHLPRRVERLRDVEGEPGAIVTTLRNLAADVEISGEPFELPTPEGYAVKRAAPGSGIGGISAQRVPDRNDRDDNGGGR